MKLVPVWFIILVTVWTVFFALEGFDFGVGALHGRIGKTESGRRAALHSIGPLWDGNEAWLIGAVAGTFAAFPSWYATMFSTFYPLLILLLAALITRGAAIEFRDKETGVRWRRNWGRLLITGSMMCPFIIGIMFGDLLHGVPINSSQEFTGSFWDLLQPYGIFTGLTLLAL